MPYGIAPPFSFLIQSVRVSIPKILRYCAETVHSKKSARLISIFYIIPKILRYSHQLANPYSVPFLSVLSNIIKVM